MSCSTSCSTRSIAAALLLAVPAAAQTTIKLNRPLLPTGEAGTVDSMQLAPDGSRVVYLAHEATDTRLELRSLLDDGAQVPVRITTGVPGAEELTDEFLVSPDGTRVVFLTRQPMVEGEEFFDITRLYSVPIGGGALPTLLARSGGAGDYLFEFQISPDGAWVVYEAHESDPRAFSEIDQLRAVPIDGHLESALLFEDDGGVGDWTPAPGGRVVLRIPATPGGPLELFSIELDGSGLVHLNGALTAGGRVESFAVSPDGSRVLYRADQTTDQVFELFSVPVDGSAPAVRVNGALVAGGDVVELVISPDSTRVAYRADQIADNRFELFVVPLDASAAAVRVSGDLIAGGDVEGEPVFGQDGQRIAWRADALVNDVVELFSAPCDGSAAPALLSGALVSGGDVLVSASSNEPDLFVGAGDRVVYRADAALNEQVELYAVAIDGSAVPVRLSPDLVPNADVDGVEITADGSRVVFDADSSSSQALELFVAQVAGGTPPVRVNVAAAVAEFAASPDGSRVYYRAAEDTPGVRELYRRSVDAVTPPVKLSGVLGSPFLQGNVATFFEDRATRRLVYVADEEVDERAELVSVTLDGPPTHVRLNDPGDDHSGFSGLGIASGRVLYVQRLSSSEGDALFSVPADRSVPPVRLSPMVPQASVRTFRTSPDGSTVVFLAGDFESGSQRLFGAPIDGSAPALELSGSLVANGEPEEALAFAADGSRVVYLADAEVVGVHELYSVRTDGSAPPVRLSQSFVAGGDVVIGHTRDAPLVAADGTVVYRADAEVDERFELYAVPVDGSAPPVKLSGALVGGGDVQPGFQLDPTGLRVLFRADRLQDDAVELFAVAMDGSAPPVRVNASLLPEGDVVDFRVHPDGTRVVYRADAEVDGSFELYAASLQGGRQVSRISGPSVHGGGVLEFELAPDGARVVYRADALVDERIELFVTPIDGGSAPALVNGPLDENGDVLDFQVAPSGRLVVYRADQERDERFEIFSAPLDGSRAPRRENEPLVVGHEVSQYRFSADESRVFYIADQDEPYVFELYQAFLRPPIVPMGTPRGSASR